MINYSRESYFKDVVARMPINEQQRIFSAGSNELFDIFLSYNINDKDVVKEAEEEEAPKRKKKAAAKKLEAPADEAPAKEAKAEEPAADVAEAVASEPANAQ